MQVLEDTSTTTKAASQAKIAEGEVIAGRICLLMISMRSETVLYGLIDAMK